MEQLLRKLERDLDSHKGQNGKVGVIAGSKDYTGAPALVSEAALRTGSDLTKILTSESVRDIVASYSENFIVEPYSADYFDRDAADKALKLAEWSDVVAIGPGLADPEPKAVRNFMQEVGAPLVIDADALEFVGRTPVRNAVLTPHGAEYKNIGEDVVHELVDRGNVVVKKGSEDFILSSDFEERVSVGTPVMTVGGTGDVLTGVIASLISQGLELDEAARLGVWISGKSGEMAAEEYGNGMLATDLIETIPKIFTR